MSSSGSSDDSSPEWRRRRRSAVLSTSSEEESSDGRSSDDEDDSMSGRFFGDKHAQAKFRRLRRIFLNQERACSPQSKRTKERSMSTKVHHYKKPLVTSRDEEEKRSCSGKASAQSNQSTKNCTRQYSATHELSMLQQTSSASPLQQEIDDQIRSLCQQVELLSAQRDANTNQREASLQRAIEDVQAVRVRQQQQLEAQVRLIEESYKVQLEILAQQYEAKVADLHREKRMTIQRQREQAESAVLDAVKQLQQETQRNLLSAGAVNAGYANTKAAHARVDLGIAPKPSGWRFREDVRSFEQVESSTSTLSPKTRQRAKLRAFEQKLRLLPQASVDRALSMQQQRQQKRVAPLSVETTSPRNIGAGQQDWERVPLSPLRSSPSRWKRGISRASQIAFSDDDRSTTSNNDINEDRDALLSVSAMSKRFLRPEEERELRRLRNSIGLAKDWIERNVQDE